MDRRRIRVRSLREVDRDVNYPAPYLGVMDREDYLSFATVLRIRD